MLSIPYSCHFFGSSSEFKGQSEAEHVLGLEVFGARFYHWHLVSEKGFSTATLSHCKHKLNTNICDIK